MINTNTITTITTTTTTATTTIGYEYQLESVAFQILFFTLPVGITVGGAWLSYSRFKAVRNLFDLGYNEVSVSDGDDGSVGGGGGVGVSGSDIELGNVITTTGNPMMN